MKGKNPVWENIGDINLKCKKGNVVLDSGMVIFMLVVFGLIGIISYITFEDLSDDISSDPDISDMAKGNISALKDRTPATLDGVFALAFGLFWLMVIAASFMIDSHPIFFIISIVLLFGILFASAYLSNAYEEFADDEEMRSAVAEFPITNFILGNLLIVMLVIGGSIAIVLFAKSRIG